MKDPNHTARKPITDPGKGNRTPAMWGRWLLDRMGLQRQVLHGLQRKPMYEGTTPRSRTDRRKVKAARRQRVHQSMARRGK